MSRMWRIVLTVVAVLLALGIVLLGAAWLTGASVYRTVELVFGGQEELEIWFRNGLGYVQSLWSALLARIQALF